MGFCRRCGDIVAGPRCKCGGLPVAPVVQWNQAGAEDEREDKWSRTYTRDKLAARPVSRGPPPSAPPEPTAPVPQRRFPRPRSSTTTLTLDRRVSEHIASYRPPSPTKSDFAADEPPSPTASDMIGVDIVRDPNTFELSKAYGSVLQPKETLQSFACAICATPFPPDATIYPDPSSPSLSADPSGRFLCRPCFVVNGGSKGDCFACQRPVLILKREGGFVETSNRVYHKQCYRCEGCYKNIGDNPMVDLLGRPSCADCFDTCLSRKDDVRLTPHIPSKEVEEKRSNIGGYASERSGFSGEGRRQTVPALEELEQRLGIRSKSREGSPAVDVPVRRHITGDLTGIRNTSTTPRWSVGGDRSAPRPSAEDDFSVLRSSIRDDGLTSRASLGGGTSTSQSLVGSDGPASRFSYREDNSASRSSLEGDSSTLRSSFRDSPSARASLGGEGSNGRTSSGDNSASRSYDRFKSPEPVTPSPRRKSISNAPASTKPTEDAIEEMKRRFMRSSLTPSDITTSRSSASSETPPPKPTTSSQDYPPPILKSRASNPSLRSTPVGNNSSNIVYSPTPERISGVAGPVTAKSLGLRSKSSMSSMSTSDAERVVNTPELVSDLSDSATQSSGATTPPIVSPLSIRPSKSQSTSRSDNTPTKPRSSASNTNSSSSIPRRTFQSKRSLENLRIPAPLSQETKCARCGIPLFTTNGGKFVTVPEEPSATGTAPKVYHSDCFRCRVCDGMFAASDSGQAIFVRSEGGPCHVECAPPVKAKTRPLSTPGRPSFSSAISSSESSYASSVSSGRFGDTSSIETSSISDRYERPPQTAGPTTMSFNRFGGANSCPGCYRAVSIMERGVVPGPQGTRWHATCLICGGQEAKGRNGRRIGDRPGCGKKLDSAAKTDGEGSVWCRECLLLIPASRRVAPSKSPAPSDTPGASFWGNRSTTPASSGRISQQFTGTTTLARQNTGRGDVPPSDNEPAILRQMTGGGLTPTRQLGLQGLAKQHTGGGGGGGVRAHYTGGGGVRTHHTGGDGVRTHHTGGGGVRTHHTGGGGVRTHYTGGSAATIRTQLTGGTTVGLRSQNTGGNSGMPPRTPVTRPKSVAAVRSHKSMDEGRGMYLVKQLTGGQTGVFGNGMI